MPIDYTEIREGDSITAAGLTDSLDKIKAEINDLDEASVEKKTLHRKHLPSPVLRARTAGRSGSDLTIRDTSDRYPGWNVVSGWNSLIETTFNGVFLSRSKTAGILVLANINVKEISAFYGGVAAWHPSYIGVFAIQYKSDGAWRHLPRSERYVDMDTGDDDAFNTHVPKFTASTYTTQITGKDVAIRTLIRNADNTSGMSITAVRLVGSVLSFFTPTTTEYCNVVVRQGNISAIAIQGEEIS
tara:strand:+ start:101 stop:829 length:729 start_codon:yes stop_codon:yes gene_type:complete